MPSSPFVPEHFLNRELSWLEFNARVLEEARAERTPLLERAKFLAIFASNLDEFFMVRVAGLREQAFSAGAPQDPPVDGLRPLEQLERISQRTRQLVQAQYACWNESVAPRLAETGIRLVREQDLEADQVKQLDKYFKQRVFPVLTPMAIDPAHPSPRFHNRGLYLAARLSRLRGIGPQSLFAVVQIPQVLPRLVPVELDGRSDFLMLEDIVAARLPLLFGGYEIREFGAFRVTRDMDIDLLDEEGDDMLRAIESRLRARQRSEAVRIEVTKTTTESLLGRLTTEEKLCRSDRDAGTGYDEVYRVDGPLDMTFLMELASLVGRPELRDPPFTPRLPAHFGPEADLFAEIARRDVLLHHPFDSFQPVVHFIQQAAADPDVLAIKQTLYRTSGDSPIIDALIEAAESGKHVTALVELKARFDEAANISWARRMERAGVHVVFGFMDLKTHCKLALVVRHEGGKKVRRYAHLGTGNYNPTTAKLYTDLGLFTSDKTITEDVSALFNFLTGYSQGHEWQKLVVAPNDLHGRTVALIDEQRQKALRGEPARVFAKLNSLLDRGVIEALYRAGQAGVQVDLLVRGICCLRPGEPGLSENIRVRSIVDRFLEHSRILVFGEGADRRVFLSSADWMPRNFERRVEVMFPVEDEGLARVITDQIIPCYLRDNQSARLLRGDGSYERIEPRPGEAPSRSQRELISLAAGALPPAPFLTASPPVPPVGGPPNACPPAPAPAAVDVAPVSPAEPPKKPGRAKPDRRARGKEPAAAEKRARDKQK